jgi:hypothetical protein
VKIVIFTMLSAFLLGAAPQAKASFGCEVLLCLAASAGTPSECKPPLKKLFKRLAKGKSFPKCKMESGPEGVGGQGNDALPQGQQGVAVWVPQHMVCREWAYRRNVRGDPVGKYCPKENQRHIKAHYDHSGKSCRQWFPRRGSFKLQDDPNYQIRRTCQSKSKKFIRVVGAGVEGKYHYY